MRIGRYFTRQDAPGVRATLGLLVLGCVLPLSLVAAFLIVEFYQRGRQQLIDSTVTQAQAAIAGVDREFDSLQAALQALGTSRQLMTGDLAGFHTRARDALGNLHADSIVLVDPSGKLLLSTRRAYGEPLPRLPGTPLLKRIVATGRGGVSDLFPGPLAGQLIYTVGVPIRRDGAIVMTLNATATPAHLTSLLAEQKLPATWRTAILDSRGKIVARSHEAAKYVGKSATPALLHSLSVRGEGSLEGRALDGLPVYTVYSRSPRTGWTVAFGIPTAELTAGLRHSLGWLIAGTLAALALGLLLAWRVGGGIAHSVRALIPPALAAGSGDMPELPPLAIREARELAQAMRDAAASVRTAQAQSRESEHRLTLAAQAARLGIWVRDQLRHEIWVSDTWRALFGFPPGQTLTMADVLGRIHPEDRPAAEAALVQPRGRYELEFRIHHPDGAERWISSQGQAECDSAGQVTLVRGVSLDITARKQAELDMLQKQKELTHLSRVAMLGELSGTLAHELNQPLTAILSNAQAAQRFLRQPRPDLDELRDILHDIIEADERASAIIRRLRSLIGNQESVLQPVVADELLSDVLHILRADLIHHGVTLHTDLAGGTLRLQADRVQLQQVLINLIINACDAMAATPAAQRQIAIRSRRYGKQWQLDVQDSGPGIPPTQLGRIFEPFFTTKSQGMGLGLAICRSIVQAHQGRLWAENSDGGGACLHLSLPELP
ncbi:sensor histidine kinase [Pseudoduganella violacea]|uniref:histidine kinase n=1 Tax=Pseudoduganella violacea TaxID=1715466 RepID=A0A7W5BB39_9BURK|nr:ATP-binding protein [Pseudoduganella violacea]MBB3119515.1 PAS domain S-box-containing protein [Pseudoduganella violacea]